MQKILIVLFFLLALYSASKISSELQNELTKSNEVDFIINLKNIKYRNLMHKGKHFDELDIETKAHFIVDTLINHSDNTQKSLENVLRQKSITYERLWIINSISVKKGTKALIEELTKRHDVESLTHDQKFTIYNEPTIPSDAPKAVEWNLEWVKATALWKKGFTGKGKVIGLVDTGVNFRHPAVSGQYVGNKNGTFDHDFAWFGPNVGQEPRDTQDHGTHCTGTALGATADKSVIIGASHDSKWIHCHFGGTFAIITRCFQFLLAPTNRQGQNPNPALRPHVTSHSYGANSQARSQLQAVIQACLDAGVHVVVAAANSARCRTIADPGHIPTVLTVGALGDKTNNIAPFSSKGPPPNVYNVTGSLKPEVSAPGTNINSATHTGSNYGRKSGTSMATPLVAGTIALLWSAVPALDRKIKETNEILYKSSLGQKTRDCESQQETPNFVYGYGTIDALKAFELAQQLYGNK